MDDFLRSDLFRVLAVVAAGAVLAKVLWRTFFPPAPGPLMQRVRCSSCNWQGTVGKHNRKCSRCASTALEDVR